MNHHIMNVGAQGGAGLAAEHMQGVRAHQVLLAARAVVDPRELGMREAQSKPSCELLIRGREAKPVVLKPWTSRQPRPRSCTPEGGEALLHEAA
jgi:hypothetical protein